MGLVGPGKQSLPRHPLRLPVMQTLSSKVKWQTISATSPTAFARVAYPHFLSQMAYYDVARNICTAHTMTWQDELFICP